MTVYVVFEYGLEFCQLHGVFSTREAAAQAQQQLSPAFPLLTTCFAVAAFVLDEPRIAAPGFSDTYELEPC